MIDWSSRLRDIFALSMAGLAGCGDSTPSTDLGSTTGPCPTVSQRSPLGADAGTVRAGDAGLDCNALCAGVNVQRVDRCEIAPGDGGLELVCVVVSFCPGGRTTEGLTLPMPGDASSGSILAAMSAMESASVAAFRRLGRELHAHGAPVELRRRALRAASDERRHARAMAALARHYGGDPREPEGEAQALRSFEEIVRENAVEGCVRETWGALLAAWQAQHARDEHARGVFAAIADDELSHAALAWEIAAWAEPRLSPAEQAAVQQARERRWDELRTTLDAANDAGAEDIGLPSAREARSLLASLRVGIG